MCGLRGRIERQVLVHISDVLGEVGACMGDLLGEVGGIGQCCSGGIREGAERVAGWGQRRLNQTNLER